MKRLSWILILTLALSMLLPAAAQAVGERTADGAIGAPAVDGAATAAVMDGASSTDAEAVPASGTDADKSTDTSPSTDKDSSSGTDKDSGSGTGADTAKSTSTGTDFSAPILKSVTATTSGVKFVWAKVSGAAKYCVLRKTSGGSWETLGVTAGSSYVDKTVKSGTKYYYTVKCVSSDGTKATSGFNTTGKSITYLAAPKVTKAANAVKGAKVTWQKVTGASGYIIYRKISGGSWKKIATVKGSSTLTYTDTKAKSGTKYFYTVQAYKGSVKSAYNKTGKGIYRLAQPTVLKVSSGNKGKVTVKWKKVTGAAGYYIYRKTAGGSWKKVGVVKSPTKVSYVDTTPKSGVKYYYSVRAYYSKTTSTYNTKGKAVTVK